MYSNFTFDILTCEELVRYFSDVKNWYQIFTNWKNRYKILTRMKHWYQILTSVRNWYQIITCEKLVSKLKRVKNWYQIIACENCCHSRNYVLFVCLILFFTSQSTLFQLRRDGSSWVEPEASSIMRALSGARCTDVRLYTL